MRTRRAHLTVAAALLTATTLAIGAVPAAASGGSGDRHDDHHGHGHGDGHGHRRDFDLQAHRGGLVVENTLPAFAKALELGVSTLELDVQITEDGHAVVTHDRDPSPAKCVDTAPAFPGDPEFPYVPNRTYIRDLTLAQVRTIDCGSLRLAQYPGAPWLLVAGLLGDRPRAVFGVPGVRGPTTPYGGVTRRTAPGSASVAM